eukprot:1760715-Amphidinium_carterae.1
MCATNNYKCSSSSKRYEANLEQVHQLSAVMLKALNSLQHSLSSACTVVGLVESRTPEHPTPVGERIGKEWVLKTLLLTYF